MFPGFAKQPFDATLGWHNDRINTIFQEKGQLTHVAADGLAWQRAMEERPELDMYYKDKLHPSVYAHYLAACVVYATVFGESPAGLTYLPSKGFGIKITEEEAAFLQRIAWETVQEYQVQK